MNIDNWIKEQENGWYWIDETGDPAGPYTTKQEAVVRLKAYCIYLEHDAEAAYAYLEEQGYRYDFPREK